MIGEGDENKKEGLTPLLDTLESRGSRTKPLWAGWVGNKTKVGGYGVRRKLKEGEGWGNLLPIFRYGCYNWHTMKLSREEVLHIARLARLGLTKKELEKFRGQLSHILENFEVLQQVDTSSTPPTAQSISLQNVVRDDEIAASLPPSQILANAPRKEEDYFRVRAVLE